MSINVTLQQIIREELTVVTRFEELIARRGMTYKLMPLPAEHAAIGSAAVVLPPVATAGSGPTERTDSADHGANKQKVVDAIRAHSGDSYNALHIASVTGLSVSAVRQVFRRLPTCGEDFVLEPGQGRRPTLYSKRPRPGTDSALIHGAAIDLAPLARNGNGHLGHADSTAQTDLLAGVEKETEP